MTRQERLQFHIEKNELFIQLATKLDCLRQLAEKNAIDNSTVAQTLKETATDLVWLHKHYRVTHK